MRRGISVPSGLSSSYNGLSYPIPKPLAESTPQIYPIPTTPPQSITSTNHPNPKISPSNTFSFNPIQNASESNIVYITPSTSPPIPSINNNHTQTYYPISSPVLTNYVYSNASVPLSSTSPSSPVATPIFISLPPPSPGRYYSRYLNEFEELGFLGKGGYGSVHKVQNKLDGLIYALKKIPFKNTNNHLLEKVLREVKTLAGLNHPNIVRYHSAWIEEEDVLTTTNSASVNRSQTRPNSLASLADSRPRSKSFTAGSKRLSPPPKCLDVVFEENANNSANIRHNEAASDIFSKPIPEEQKQQNWIDEDEFTDPSLSSSSSDMEQFNPFPIEDDEFTESVPQSSSSGINISSSGDYSNSKSSKISSSSQIVAPVPQTVCHPLNFNLNFPSLSSSVPNLSRLSWVNDVSNLRATYPSHPLAPLHTHSPSPLLLQVCNVSKPTLFIVMQLYANSLCQWLENRPADKVDPAENMDIFRQICNALKYIHSKSIIHRDMKPENIFITPKNDPTEGGSKYLVCLGISDWQSNTESLPTAAGPPHQLRPAMGAPHPPNPPRKQNSVNVKITTTPMD
eukprot:TRINITY_DN5381_c0_g1_i2.p1 TRINITY_DN5381_c0_g1~~TRINITY_DN5381_c0_g1_i2.p1  ORF type:complete len:568 (-),score=101.96 TRINITY_DN5381_c0_g1_i2:51-1754(-)